MPMAKRKNKNRVGQHASTILPTKNIVRAPVTSMPPKRVPVRVPVLAAPPKRTPKRTPVLEILTESDDTLIQRVKDKAANYIPPKPLAPEDIQKAKEIKGGLGELFKENKFEITEEELIECAEYSVHDEKEDSTWEALTAQMVKSSCAFMAQELLTGPPGPPYNGKFLINEHHEEWDDLVCNHDRVCVLSSRDSGKTFFFNFAYPIWKAITQPNGIGFIFSATQPQAERILEDIKAELEANPKLQWLVPTRKDKWSSTHIRLSNGHRIYARSFGTKVRGAHPNWIVVDDGINDEVAYSELIRQKTKDYFYTAITNMIVPGGQIIVVGCVTLDTWVATENGLQRIGKLNPGDNTPEVYHDLDLQVAGRHGFQKANKYWVQGEVPTKKVSLEYGYQLEGSHRHPFLVMGEDGIPHWQRADELETGMFVAVKPGVNAWGPDIPIRLAKRNGRYRNAIKAPPIVTEDFAYLAGLWTAEGSYEKTGRIMISNTETEIRDWLLTAPFGMNFKVNSSEGSEQTLRCSSKSFLEVLEYLGATLGTASKKTIPEKIMSGPKKIAKAFLQGLFDGDGCVWVSQGNKQQQVFLATTSEQLARDAQILLLNFGIVSSLIKKPPAKPTKKVPQGGTYPCYWIRMLAHEATLFMQRIGFRLHRKQSAIADMVTGTFSSVRGIPHQASHIALARKEKPRRKRSPQLNQPPINISEIANAVRPERVSLQRVIDWFVQYGSNGDGVAGIKRNLEEDLVWLQIKKIDDSKNFTVDFVIEGDHSFVTNGIVSHNTPFHMDDLYADLEKNPEYEFKKYQAFKKDGTPLWADRYDKERLEKRKAEIGSIRFSREFQCDPVSDSMSLFPEHLFKGDPTEQYNLVLGMPLAFWEEAGVQRYMGVDFAMSSSVQADYTVVWTMGIDNYGNRWIIDIQREHGMPYQEQLSLINKIGRKYDPALIFLEANQMQRIFGDELIRTSDLPIKQFVTGIQKNSLDKGVPSLRVLLENKKFRIPRGDARSVELTDIWIDEMRSFTWADGKLKSVGGHDDLPMAAWICDQAIRQGGFQFTFGDEYTTDNSKESMDKLMAELTGTTDKSDNSKGAKRPTDKSGDNGNSKKEEPGTINLADPELFGGAPLPNLFNW